MLIRREASLYAGEMSIELRARWGEDAKGGLFLHFERLMGISIQSFDSFRDLLDLNGSNAGVNCLLGIFPSGQFGIAFITIDSNASESHFSTAPGQQELGKASCRPAPAG